jgi:hypothetical protein
MRSIPPRIVYHGPHWSPPTRTLAPFLPEKHLIPRLHPPAAAAPGVVLEGAVLLLRWGGLRLGLHVQGRKAPVQRTPCHTQPTHTDTRHAPPTLPIQRPQLVRSI